MVIEAIYSRAARVQGILRTLGARQGITIGELAEEFSVTKRTILPGSQGFGGGRLFGHFGSC